MGWKDLTGQTKGAVIVALLGFVLRVTSTSQSSINGVVTCSHTDFGALALGVLAIVLGGMSAMSAAGPARSLNVVLGGAAALVGVLHILRGLGMVGGPCG